MYVLCEQLISSLLAQCLIIAEDISTRPYILKYTALTVMSMSYLFLLGTLKDKYRKLPITLTLHEMSEY